MNVPEKMWAAGSGDRRSAKPGSSPSNLVPSNIRPSGPDDWHGSGTVLVVDDEPGVRAMLCRALQRMGFETITATNGLEAVERVLSGEPANLRLLLMDFTMPHLNGAEALKEIRKTQPDLPVIMMTGLLIEDVRDALGSTKVSLLLQKPFTPQQLKKHLRTILG